MERKIENKTPVKQEISVSPAQEEHNKIHPLHRILYTPHVVAYALMNVLFWIWMPWPWATKYLCVAIFFLVWPHVAWMIGKKSMPTLRGAQVIIVSDAVIFCLLWPIMDWSVIHLFFAFTALTVNCTSCGGMQLVKWGLLSSVMSIGVVLVIFGWPKWNPPPIVVFMVMMIFTLIYCGFVGLAAHTTGLRLTASRAQLRDLTEKLEQRVLERTAELRSANDAFMRFVPAEFLHALGYHDISKAKLGDAASRVVTVLFSDIRNFTKLSEQMTPEETFGFLNACLSKVGPHVRVHGGFIDKYIGDAIMALFPSNPAQAVRAGIAMLREVKNYNARRQQDSSRLSIGIGIHVGKVIMGTVGEEMRFEVTVISDTVNLTARLESLTKQLGCSMLISQDVANELTQEEIAHTRWVGTFIVKGKSSPVDLVEVFAADDEALREHKTGTQQQLQQAIECYRAGDLEGALGGVAAIVTRNAADGVASWWRERVTRELKSAQGPGRREHVYLDEK